jgi:hypothetical protein
MGKGKGKQRRHAAKHLTPALLRLSRPAAPEEVLQRGTVTIAMVAHDDWCAYFTGKACSCEPEVSYRTVDQATLDHPAEPGQG